MNLAGFLCSLVIFLATRSLAWSQDISSPNAREGLVQSGQSVKPGVVRPNQGLDPLFDLPPLKRDRASLIGGTLENIDWLRGRFILRPFGGGRLTVVFDPRTQFVRDGKTGSARDMHHRDQVYVETVLDGTAVFAKTIHVFTGGALGASIGQVVAYDPSRGALSIRDRLASRPIQFQVTSKTIVTGASISPGALVQISFQGGKGPAIVSEILVLAAPGSVFTFAGRITFLDFASHELVVANTSDDNRYEIQFNPAAVEAAAKERLQEGASVTIAARFNGQRYVAESVTVLPDSAE
jgi:hypothetical protein